MANNLELMEGITNKQVSETPAGNAEPILATPIKTAQAQPSLIPPTNAEVPTGSFEDELQNFEFSSETEGALLDLEYDPNIEILEREPLQGDNTTIEYWTEHFIGNPNRTPTDIEWGKWRNDFLNPEKSGIPLTQEQGEKVVKRVDQTINSRDGFDSYYKGQIYDAYKRFQGNEYPANVYNQIGIAESLGVSEDELQKIVTQFEQPNSKIKTLYEGEKFRRNNMVNAYTDLFQKWSPHNPDSFIFSPDINGEDAVDIKEALRTDLTQAGIINYINEDDGYLYFRNPETNNWEVATPGVLDEIMGMRRQLILEAGGIYGGLKFGGRVIEAMSWTHPAARFITKGLSAGAFGALGAVAGNRLDAAALASSYVNYKDFKRNIYSFSGSAGLDSAILGLAFDSIPGAAKVIKEAPTVVTGLVKEFFKGNPVDRSLKGIIDSGYFDNNPHITAKELEDFMHRFNTTVADESILNLIRNLDDGRSKFSFSGTAHFLRGGLKDLNFLENPQLTEQTLSIVAKNMRGDFLTKRNQGIPLEERIKGIQLDEGTNNFLKSNRIDKDTFLRQMDYLSSYAFLTNFYQTNLRHTTKHKAYGIPGFNSFTHQEILDTIGLKTTLKPEQISGLSNALKETTTKTSRLSQNVLEGLFSPGVNNKALLNSNQLVTFSRDFLQWDYGLATQKEALDYLEKSGFGEQATYKDVVNKYVSLLSLDSSRLSIQDKKFLNAVSSKIENDLVFTYGDKADNLIKNFRFHKQILMTSAKQNLVDVLTKLSNPRRVGKEIPSILESLSKNLDSNSPYETSHLISMVSNSLDRPEDIMTWETLVLRELIGQGAFTKPSAVDTAKISLDLKNVDFQVEGFNELRDELLFLERWHRGYSSANFHDSLQFTGKLLQDRKLGLGQTIGSRFQYGAVDIILGAILNSNVFADTVSAIGKRTGGSKSVIYAQQLQRSQADPGVIRWIMNQDLKVANKENFKKKINRFGNFLGQRFSNIEGFKESVETFAETYMPQFKYDFKNFSDADYGRLLIQQMRMMYHIGLNPNQEVLIGKVPKKITGTNGLTGLVLEKSSYENAVKELFNMNDVVAGPVIFREGDVLPLDNDDAMRSFAMSSNLNVEEFLTADPKKQQEMINASGDPTAQVVSKKRADGKEVYFATSFGDIRNSTHKKTAESEIQALQKLNNVNFIARIPNGGCN